MTENIRQKLLANGYTELSERERWEVAPGGKYFVRRNGSSTIAFRVPEMIDGGFAMAAAHSDSPAFRLKSIPTAAARIMSSSRPKNTAAC